jgi:hypothetical protein
MLLSVLPSLHVFSATNILCHHCRLCEQEITSDKSCSFHEHWGALVNVLPPSHVFGERGLMRLGPRNATVAQMSAGNGRLLRISGFDYQAIKAGKDPLHVQVKVPALSVFPFPIPMAGWTLR